MTLLFGLIILVYLAVYALVLVSVPSLVLSYSVALFAWPRQSIGGRIRRQLGVLVLSMAVLAAVMVVVLFLGVSGGGSSGLKVYGVNLFELKLLLIPLGLCLPTIVTGELLMAWRRRS
jgi:hypothetical protein